MQRFHQEIDTINRVIASFNKYLAPQFPVPRFDKDTAIERKNIVEILHGNWDGFTFPNNRTQVFILFSAMKSPDGKERIICRKGFCWIMD
jgi:hypothetical protein